MIEITCKCGCGQKKMVREADVKRGWGKYYSKSCKARHQEKRTGLYKRFINRCRDSDTGHNEGIDTMESGWDGHKNAI